MLTITLHLPRPFASSSGRSPISFRGESFMARGVGRDVPRYIPHVTGHSEPIERLVGLDRTHRSSPQ